MAGLTLLLCACDSQQGAPSPSNSGALSQTELTELRRTSEQGNNDAMYRLAIYYLFHEQDDKQGWSWMEKAAEAGNSEARKSVIEHYADQDSAEERAHGEMLRKKWEADSATR